MLQLVPQQRILIAVDPIDFRCGIEGLSRCCRAIFQDDPMSGTLFVFRNKSRNALKLLLYDGQGFWLFHKRLSQGKLQWWPKETTDNHITLNSQELHVLLYNGYPKDARFAKNWRALS